MLKCSDMIDRDQGWLNDKGELQVQAEIRGLPSFSPTVPSYDSYELMRKWVHFGKYQKNPKEI